MDLARVRERCEQQIRRLRISPPLNVAALCEGLARERDRPIRLLPLSSRPSNPSGLWVSAKTADYIFYEESAGSVHREHIILHEIGHLVFGHSGVADLDDLTARLLAPNLDPKVVRRLLCRGKYDDVHEQEAELFATLVLLRADFQVVPVRGPDIIDDPSGVLAKLKAVLGGTTMLRAFHLAVIALAWIGVGYKLIDLRRRPDDRGRLALCSALLFLALALTVGLPPLYQRIPLFAGSPSLVRLVQHGLAVLAVFSTQLLVVHLASPPGRTAANVRVRAAVMVVFLTTMIALFAAASPGDAAEDFVAAYATWPFVTEYLLTFLGFVAVVMADIFRLSLRFTRRATAGFLRAGLWLWAGASAAGFAFAVHKAAYALADGHSLDLIDFRDLVARGRRDRAAEHRLLTQALALWRGPALANVDSDALHRDEVAELEEEHRHARERWFELALRAGEGPAIIGRLKAAVVASPMSERLSGQLMIALYQAGRQAEALEVYEELRVTLRDELGLEPAEALRRLLRSLGVAPAAVSAEPGEAARLLRSLTAGRRMLFVLDNARDVAQVRDLLPGGAGCRVLLTSRRLLADLDGAEHVQLDVFSPEESYELLERLVGAARLAAEPQAAAQVVRHCGGLPLAVHIAATRLVSRPAWPVAVLADRLGAQHRRMNELRAGDRAIRATFSTSYQQLQAERHGAAATRVFDLLGLFDGADLGTDTVAALADLPAERAWQLLELLADVRLLQTDEPGRYRMHHLARLFARERAATRGPDAPQAVRRVLHHFLATARRAVRLLNPHPEWPAAIDPVTPVHTGSRLAGPQAAREWADAEAPNLVAVVRQAAETGDDDLTIGLASSLSHLMLHRGRWDQVRQIRRVAAHMVQPGGDPRAGLGVPLPSRGRLAVAPRVHAPDRASLG